jgi:exodeoxyribonuclease VII large subunit
MQKSVGALIKNKEIMLNQIQHSLSLLSPESILSRGYSITTDQKGNIIKSLDGIVIGQLIDVKLANGKIRSQVKSKYKS